MPRLDYAGQALVTLSISYDSVLPDFANCLIKGVLMFVGHFKNKALNIYFLFLIVFLTELIRTAFITDDAGITLRSVLNFINGFGPNFNIDERVQAYTHPLWFLLLSGVTLVTGDVFLSTFLLSVSVSVAVTYILAIRLASSTSWLIVALFAIVFSKSYIDFSTSGLENPLSHLCIIFSLLFGLCAYKQHSNKCYFAFYLSLGFLYLTRQDLILLLVPLAVLITVRGFQVARWQIVYAIAVGVMPIVLWTFFALFYYGFPFPNTAYAKLATGIDKIDLVRQGVLYFKESFILDPLTLVVICIGSVAGCIHGREARSLAVGVLLYLSYIIYIGGDFMAGRFFTSPFLVALVLLVRTEPNKLLVGLVLIITLSLGLFNINHTLLSGRDYVRARYPSNGVDDVRGFYYQTQGLLTAFWGKDKSAFISDWTVGDRRVQVTCGNMGFQSLFLGPSVHLIDLCALSDPLLARLPAIKGPWQSGHFFRALPAGYLESVTQDKNVVVDPQTNSLYRSIRLISRGKLSDQNRLKEIVNFNLSGGPKINRDLYRYSINLNESIYFKAHSKGTSFLQEGYSDGVPNNGWASPEAWGVWGLGNIARLSLPIPTLEQPERLKLTLQVLTSARLPSQTIEIFEVVGGGYTADGPIARYSGGQANLLTKLEVVGVADLDLRHIEVALPINPQRSLDGRNYINLEFRFPTPLKPQVIGGDVNDSRDLAMGLLSARFE